MSFHQSLKKEGYIVKKDQIDEKTMKQIKKDLTVSPIVIKAYQDFVKPNEFEIFQESANYLFIPRYYGIEQFGPPKKNYLPNGTPINLKFIYNLLPHQIVGYQKTLKALKECGGGILQVYCGYGKTFCAIKIAVELGCKTLVVVNKECLMDQWFESIMKFTDGQARIGIVQQSKVDVQDKDFVITMLHSLCKKDYPSTIFNDIGLCIADEVHHLGSEMFSKALPKMASKYMLGLSATPNRKDGLSHVFQKYIGNVCHSEKRSGSNRVLVKRFQLSSHSSFYETIYMSNGIKNNVAMTTNLSKCDVRTALIIETIRTLMKQDRKILLLSGRREHLEDIYKRLEESNIQTIFGNKITFGYYRGNQGENKKKHKQMLQESAKCDVVLGTFAISSEGMDLPNLNTEIISTPITDVEQSVGRILRKFHDKINPIVIDLVDQCGNFTRQASTRAKFYKSEGYEIHNLKIPLGNEIQDLQPFVSQINDYLLDTKLKLDDSDEGDEGDDGDEGDEDEEDDKKKSIQPKKCQL